MYVCISCSAALKMPPDAYNRTPEVTESQFENHTSDSVDQWERRCVCVAHWGGIRSVCKWYS